MKKQTILISLIAFLLLIGCNKDDDDIVARQLREAAENETDPELKEKLWKEYEAYKKNMR